MLAQPQGTPRNELCGLPGALRPDPPLPARPPHSLRGAGGGRVRGLERAAGSLFRLRHSRWVSQTPGSRVCVRGHEWTPFGIGNGQCRTHTRTRISDVLFASQCL